MTKRKLTEEELLHEYLGSIPKDDKTDYLLSLIGDWDTDTLIEFATSHMSDFYESNPNEIDEEYYVCAVETDERDILEQYANKHNITCTDWEDEEEREAPVVAEKKCTCGAEITRSPEHSSWCDIL